MCTVLDPRAETIACQMPAFIICEANHAFRRLITKKLIPNARKCTSFGSTSSASSEKQATY